MGFLAAAMPIIEGLSAVVGVVGGIAAASQANAAAQAQQNAQRIQNNEQQVQSANQQRMAIREDRIRRARILQGAANAGTTASSGALGSVGVLQTNLDNNIANSNAMTVGNTAINSYNQTAANDEANAKFIEGITSGISGGLNQVTNIWKNTPGNSVFDNGTGQ
jgi:hypothetical protein